MSDDAISNVMPEPAYRLTKATKAQLFELLDFIRLQAQALGFSQIGVSDLNVSDATPRLQEWLRRGYHGDMAYMQEGAELRAQPGKLVPGVVRSISVRMNYLPIQTQTDNAQQAVEHYLGKERERIKQPQEAVVSVYARGRDYHKLMRTRLQKLADAIGESIGEFGYRVFTDSAPVMEVELARKAGLGWRGKHTLLLHREAGSFFFLGEILVDVPLPASEHISANCGICQECMHICPTKAIVEPYVVDARRCISYLTIEHQGTIPIELRPLIGNRIYGCDDCQTFCPWNKFAQPAVLADFEPRNGLEGASLLQLWQWSEADFNTKLEGGAIRRIGYVRWLRNLAVAIGNALAACKDEQQSAVIREALCERADHDEPLVREHVQWALSQEPA